MSCCNYDVRKVQLCMFLTAHQPAQRCWRLLQGKHRLSHWTGLGQIWLLPETALSAHSGLLLQVLRPEQIALCIVDSYPFVPDWMAMSCWVAYAAGDAHALELLIPNSQHSGLHDMHSPPLSPGSTEGEQLPIDVCQAEGHKHLSWELQCK